MTQLPAGTVTLVFTDIEGSTALLSRLGNAYAEAIDAMRLVLRTAWQEFGGVEMGTEGDSFFVVFSAAPAALAAVVKEITEDVRKYAAEQGVSEQEALQKGMEDKSRVFVEQGTRC